MKRHKRVRDSRPPAQPPGSLIHVGATRAHSMRIQSLHYDQDNVEDHPNSDINHCLTQIRKSDGKRLWLRVVGLHEVEKISQLLTPLNIHPLTQEDILNTNHRPKIEDLGSLIFITLKSFTSTKNNEHPEPEQISILISNGLIITFQESETDIFSPLIHRLKNGSGRLRRNGTDYLLWGILDTIVDHYLLSLDTMELKVEAIDEQLMSNPTSIDIRTIHSLKSELLEMQRLVRPTREIVGNLERGDSPLISDTNHIYFRDLFDHTMRCVEDLEVLRESINGLRDHYLSAASNRMNEVMKVLTCISTIFLPLTFLAGVYGMNFHWMPELSWTGSYPTLWLIFLTSAGLMYYQFRKHKWL